MLVGEPEPEPKLLSKLIRVPDGDHVLGEFAGAVAAIGLPIQVAIASRHIPRIVNLPLQLGFEPAYFGIHCDKIKPTRLSRLLLQLKNGSSHAERFSKVPLNPQLDVNELVGIEAHIRCAQVCKLLTALRQKGLAIAGVDRHGVHWFINNTSAGRICVVDLTPSPYVDTRSIQLRYLKIKAVKAYAQHEFQRIQDIDFILQIK